MSQTDVYKCVERFRGRETSVICPRSGWPANVTCVEFKEIWRENFDEVVSDSSCEKNCFSYSESTQKDVIRTSADDWPKRIRN